MLRRPKLFYLRRYLNINKNENSVNRLKLSSNWCEFGILKRFYCSKSTNLKYDENSSFAKKLDRGPSFIEFLQDRNEQEVELTNKIDQHFSHPYIKSEDVSGSNRKVFIETYGCQMNVNDTEIAKSVLKNAGFKETTELKQADIILVMTCAIREGAEQTIWNRLEFLKSLKKNRQKRGINPPIKIGLLGCMAERLKEKVIEKEKLVDIVAGPDSYRDLPHLLTEAESGRSAINVQLSLEETYADILPVRINPDAPSAFVSIMRGCDNMCSYCIVPFTRGRERSRPITSILEEIKILYQEGIKEVVLLGQNVNSYRDMTKESHSFVTTRTNNANPSTAKGFRTIYKTKIGGLRFADLLDQVSSQCPEMRIRFTSPHPKDFPDEVLHVIKDRPNICNQLHLPAQSGNTEVLKSMRRGYSREAYLDLVQHVRSILPDVALTSDFICGFCGETDDHHKDTVSLLKLAQYEYVYVFPYSMREKTNAFHRLKDDVPKDVKLERATEVSNVFRNIALELHQKQIGTEQLILIEGTSKRSADFLAGRNEKNTKVIIPKTEILSGDHDRPIQKGDYVVVKIQDCSSQVLKGTAIHFSSIREFYSK